MKQYSSVIARDLSFTYAKRYIEDNKGYTFISRPEWEGFHFISKDGLWCIYTKEGKLLVDVPLEVVQKQNERGWMIVKIKEDIIEDIIDLLDEDNL